MEPVAPRSTAHDSLIVLGAQATKVVFYGLSIVVLARLLDQRDFGLMAMVTVVIGLGELFRDFGLSLAAIQAPSVSDEQRANLFWLNVGIGTALTVGAAALSGPISAFYGRPEVAPLLTAAALVFTFNGAAAQYRAGLVRQRRFAAIAASDIIGLVFAFSVGVCAALAGAGAFALVAQVLTQSVVALVIVLLLGRWLPGLPTRRAEMRSFVGFSLNLLGVQVLTYVSRNLDNVLIGRFFGPVWLGYYSKAYQLYSQPQTQGISPFTDLAVNALARVRHDPAAYLRLLLKVQTTTTYATLSGFAFVIAAAQPIVRVVLGPGWSETADLLRILSIGGTFQILGNVYFWMFLSKGSSRVLLIAASVAQPVAIAAIFLGTLWGTTGVAWAVSAGMIVEWLIPATWGAARAGVRPVLLLRNTIRPLLVALVVLIAVAGAATAAEGGGPVLQLLVGAVAAVCGVGLVAVVVPAVGRDIRDVSAPLAARLRTRIAR